MDLLDELVCGCLHFIVIRTGDNIFRPLGSALQGDSPNEVVYISFWYIGASNGPKKFILIIRDDLFGYVWFWQSSAANRKESVHEKSTWISAFGVSIWLASNQGTHFKDSLIQRLTTKLKVHITIFS